MNKLKLHFALSGSHIFHIVKENNEWALHTLYILLFLRILHIYFFFLSSPAYSGSQLQRILPVCHIERRTRKKAKNIFLSFFFFKKKKGWKDLTWEIGIITVHLTGAHSVFTFLLIIFLERVVVIVQLLLHFTTLLDAR